MSLHDSFNINQTRSQQVIINAVLVAVILDHDLNFFKRSGFVTVR